MAMNSFKSIFLTIAFFSCQQNGRDVAQVNYSDPQSVKTSQNAIQEMKEIKVEDKLVVQEEAAPAEMTATSTEMSTETSTDPCPEALINQLSTVTDIQLPLSSNYTLPLITQDPSSQPINISYQLVGDSMNSLDFDESQGILSVKSGATVAVGTVFNLSAMSAEGSQECGTINVTISE